MSKISEIMDEDEKMLKDGEAMKEGWRKYLKLNECWEKECSSYNGRNWVEVEEYTYKEVKYMK